MQVSSVGWSLYVDPAYSSQYNAHVSKWKRCEGCSLFGGKRVFYRGSLPAKVIFCGEHPGEAETVNGFPFVGPAGRLLDSLIQQAIPRVPFLVCNLVLCTPPRLSGIVRATLPIERSVCIDRIKELQDICGAKLITIGEQTRKTFGTAADGNIVQPYYIMKLGDQHVKRAIEMRAVISKIKRVYGGTDDADDNRIVRSRQVSRR